MKTTPMYPPSSTDRRFPLNLRFSSLLFSLSLLLCLGMTLQAQTTVESVEQLEEEAGRPMTFEDMYALGRVSDPQISPDGESILYVIAWYSLENNNANRDIYSVDPEGKNVIRLTETPGTDYSPRWSPDGKTIAFISTREGGAQIWLMKPDGSGQRKYTDVPTGVSEFVWSPTGSHFAYSSSVFADCEDDDCNRKRLDAKESNPVKARIIDRLPYRVWNYWKEGMFSHVFVIPAESSNPEGGNAEGAGAFTGNAVDVTPGEFDTPPIDLGGHQDFVFSPDGKEIAFVKNTDKMVAASTNNDIWLVNIDGTDARCITKENRANDNQPVYSADGRFLAYRSMSRPGYEADKYDLKVFNRKTGKTVNLTHDLDRSVDQIIWSEGAERLLFTAQDGPYKSLFDMPREGGDILRVLKGIVTLRFKDKDSFKNVDLGTYRSSFRLHPDGKTVVFVGQRINYPAELMSIVYDEGELKQIRQITQTNLELLSELDLPAAESFTFKSFDNSEVQGWILTPPGFDSSKTWPMIFLVHGGPQGAWNDNFHYRWNMELFASPGYVVVAINCRGSVGFGQAFTDGVNLDWGGAPYEDLMSGLDHVLENYSFIDKNRIGAAGASYGGYMMNWLLGNTDRFKALFSHDGVYDLVSMYGGTEELWFPEWEFGGTPWTNPKMYEKWSPSRLAAKFKTPTYVVHGQLDYRVPLEQSMQLFTALQRQGVESKFLYFPDEGHLVLKPRNSQLWYKEFHSWFGSHLLK